MHIKNLSLTDFSSDELNWLYLTLDEKRKDLEHNIETEEAKDSSVERSQSLYTLVLDFNKCKRFQAKAKEAIKFVKAIENMLSSN